MSDFEISQYIEGSDLAIAVIQDAPKDEQKAVAQSLLVNVIPPITGCSLTQGLIDTARDFANGGKRIIPVWMQYEPLMSA
jgi:hypothetical protein